MAKRPSLKSINRLRFLHNNDERKQKIEAAPTTPQPKEFPVNKLSRQLHPDKQFVTIGEIKVWDDNCKSFTFIPDPTRGTEELAFFKAGSYLSVFLDVNGMKLTRPYSISSSPQEALDGKVTLTIKRVAGGSGITPFHSFAKAIAEGDEDFNLVLLYGSRTEKDILFKDAFDAIQKQTDKVKVVHVLSDEEKPGYEYGFITADLIRKYAPAEDYSIFLCGPAGMYSFLDKQIETLHLERKWVRHELQGEVHNPEKLPDYPTDRTVPAEVKIAVRICGEEQTITASTSDTILQSPEKNGIAAPAHCRSGECGWCHSLLLSGEVYCPKHLEHRREADFDFGYIHPCCTFPLSDIAVEVPYAK